MFIGEYQQKLEKVCSTSSLYFPPDAVVHEDSEVKVNNGMGTLSNCFRTD